MTDDELADLHAGMKGRTLDDIATAAFHAELRLRDKADALHRLAAETIARSVAMPDDDDLAVIRDAIVFVRMHTALGTLAGLRGRINEGEFGG